MSEEKTYDQVVEDICSRRRFGSVSGRAATYALMEALGHPEEELNIIHIAGTNGKGSTAAFIDSILRAASFNVGLFTSPHLVDFSERIQVNGQCIPKDAVIRLGQGIMSLELPVELTMFDIALGIAVLYFVEQQVDYVVLETGLGGRLDSTSGLFVKPLVSIITSIGLEHTAILGDTIEKIAAEKAGILQENSVCLMSALIPDEAKQVICEEAIRNHALFQAIAPLDDSVELGLDGLYQRSNAALAVAAARIMGISGEDILAGLKDARWPGRLEKVTFDGRDMILDGAHNPQGMRAMCDSLAGLYPGKKFSFLMGVMADKDYGTMIDILKDSGIVDSMHVVSVAYSRTLSAEDLEKAFVVKGMQAVACDSLEVGLKAAGEKCLEVPVIVCGSLYFIGEVKGLLGDKQ